MGLPWWLRQSRICPQCRRPGFDPWVGKTAWRREWLPSPVFLPGESHGQRSLAGYSPWGHKESDTTEQLTLSLSYFVHYWATNTFTFIFCTGLPGGSVVKNMPANAGDLSSISGLERSPGEGNGSPLQYSGLGNLMDRGAWWVTVHEVINSWTQFSN